MWTQCHARLLLESPKTTHFRYFRWVLESLMMLYHTWGPPLLATCLVAAVACCSSAVRFALWGTDISVCKGSAFWPLADTLSLTTASLRLSQGPNGSWGKKWGEDSWTEIGIWYVYRMLFHCSQVYTAYMIIYISKQIYIILYHRIASSGFGSLQGSLQPPQVIQIQTWQVSLKPLVCMRTLGRDGRVYLG